MSEQLKGLGRILADVVVPELHDPYPADILAGVMASLQGLGRAWYELPAFLDWDTQSTTALLANALPALTGGLAVAVDDALAEAPLQPFDLVGLEARHARVRALLAQAVPQILSKPELAQVRIEMVALFRARAQRFPFALAARPPAPRPVHP